MDPSREVQRNESDEQPTDPRRIKIFVSFFKGYMSVFSVAAAALPIPLTTKLTWIPAYTFQRNIFAGFTSLFCFLLLAYIFYMRHSLAPLMFPTRLKERGQSDRGVRFLTFLVRFIPLFLIGLCFVSAMSYIFVLASSVPHQIYGGVTEGTASVDKVSFFHYLETADPNDVDISSQLLLFAFYLCFFLSAMTAFILMALKEHLRDILHYTDRGLIEGQASQATSDASG